MTKLLDLSGKRFGRWTVIERAPNSDSGRTMWLCRCDCGNERNVIACNLTGKHPSQSCGCYNIEKLHGKLLDLIGMKFGKLTVIRKHETSKHRDTIWECMCDCGGVAFCLGSNLRGGTSRSCGCYAKQRSSECSTKDITNQRFGHLVAIKDLGRGDRNTHIWLCLCDCGKEHKVALSDLVSRHTKSCGCSRLENVITHGMSRTPEYNRVVYRKRRELSYIADSEWTAEMERELSIVFPRCIWCNTDADLSTDHVLPLALNNGLRPGNAVRLCRKCNSSKGKKLPEQLSLERREKLISSAKMFEDHWNLVKSV